MISTFVGRYFYYLFLVILGLNLMQRRHRADVKRKATLIWAAAAFVLTVAGMLISRSSQLTGSRLPESYMAAAILLVGLGLFLARRQVWPFRRSCRRCEIRLGWKAWLTRDSNLCDTCAADSPAHNNQTETA